MNNTEKLYEVIYKILGQKELKREHKKWNELPVALKKILEGAMHGGIPRDSATYLLCTVGQTSLCLAEYADAENDFHANYLVYRNELVYSYEN